MNKGVFILIVVIILAFNSCKKRNPHEMIFPNQVSLSGEVLNIKNLFIGSPLKILYAKNFLIIIDNQEHNFIKIIDLQTNELVNEFGDIGNGPNEFRSFEDAWINKWNNNFEVLDDVNKTIYKIPIDSLASVKFNNVKNKILKKTPPELKTILTFKMHSISYSTYISSGLIETGRFAIFDTTGTYLRAFDNFDFYGDDFKKFSNVENGMALQGSFSVCEENGRFVFADLNSACIQFYETSNYKINPIQKVKYYINPPKKIHNSIAIKGSIPWAYISVTSSIDNVYALYSGKSYDEYQANVNNCSVIHIYDWNGKQIKQYNLDVPISKMCYDEDRESLIGIRLMPEPSIVIFNLDK